MGYYLNTPLDGAPALPENSAINRSGGFVFVIHQLAHALEEARQFEETRKKASDLKSQLGYRKGSFAR